MAVPAGSSCEGMKLKQPSAGRPGTPTVEAPAAPPKGHHTRDVSEHIPNAAIYKMGVSLRHYSLCEGETLGRYSGFGNRRATSCS